MTLSLHQVSPQRVHVADSCRVSSLRTTHDSCTANPCACLIDENLFKFTRRSGLVEVLSSRTLSQPFFGQKRRSLKLPSHLLDKHIRKYSPRFVDKHKSSSNTFQNKYAVENSVTPESAIATAAKEIIRKSRIVGKPQTIAARAMKWDAGTVASLLHAIVWFSDRLLSAASLAPGCDCH